MRDLETARLLDDVRKAVGNARTGGVTARACIFDATAAAVDGDARHWHSPEARSTAEAVCRAVEAPTVTAGPQPVPAPPTACILRRLADRITERAQRRAGRESCTCDLWGPSIGREHDDWCPNNETFWRAI